MSPSFSSTSSRLRFASPTAVLLVAVAAAVLAGIALGAVLRPQTHFSTATVTAGSPSVPGPQPSSAAANDPAAYYAGRAMAGNGDSAVPLSQAETLADQIPDGAEVDRRANTIRFTTSSVRFALAASPPAADMAFRAAGMRDPTIEVPAGAQVTVEFVNADSDMAHMWLLASAVTGGRIAGARPLGDPTGAGQPVETISFTAQPSGSYRYFCSFPGHASQGMRGRFVVGPQLAPRSA